MEKITLEQQIIDDFWMWCCNCANPITAAQNDTQREQISNYFYWLEKDLQRLPYWNNTELTPEQDNAIDTIVAKCAVDIIDHIFTK